MSFSLVSLFAPIIFLQIPFLYKPPTHSHPFSLTTSLYHPLLKPLQEDDLCGLSLSIRFNSNLLTIWNRDGAATETISGILSVILSKISPELRPKEGSYYYKKHSEHASFNDAVAKANERALISGKIEEAKVQEEEVREVEEEERRREEEDERRRSRSQTVG